VYAGEVARRGTPSAGAELKPYAERIQEGGMQQTSLQLLTVIALFLFAVAQAAHPGGSTSVAGSEVPVVHSAAKDFTYVIHQQRVRRLLDAPAIVKRVGVSTVDQLLVRPSSHLVGVSKVACYPH
jgi:hypothetical protein